MLTAVFKSGNATGEATETSIITEQKYNRRGSRKMNYITYYKNENEAVKERYQLVMDRVSQIAQGENTIPEKFREYFIGQAEKLLYIKKLYDLSETGEYRKKSEQELKAINDDLHSELRNNYDTSWLNPEYMMKNIGEEYGKYLLWLGVSIRNLIEPALSLKLEVIVLYTELFVQIYNLFETEDLSEKTLKDIQYWFKHDCNEVLLDYSIADVNWQRDFASSIIMEADLSDTRYLYFYGANITRNEIEASKLLAGFSQEKIDEMARTFTNGYINGFKLLGKDLSKKGAVELRYNIGFERMMRAAIKQFEEIGLKPVILSEYYTYTPANRQYSYDHRYFDAHLLDKCLTDRDIELYKVIFEKYKDFITPIAGPAVLEVFGEKPFEPKSKPENLKYTDKQQKLKIEFKREYMDIYHKYIKPEDRSFTIIAYPVADIGEKYKEIFEETIKINNLDQNVYREIQACIINALDEGEYAEIKGMNGNRTDLKVALMPLNNPEKETLFENCLADVNIPLGEVFTTPKLKGTNGTLHVTQVFLNNLNYIDIDLKFKDGCVSDYTCKNFGDDEAANKAYIKENLLNGHDTLPIGEFAIGTNTTAYVMGRKYDIMSVMPILIVEKTGPHFAVGDTCYCFDEDAKTYNPDGKEIIAKSNDFSDLRNTQPEKAYFNCHTDITIPYSELGSIDVIKKDGSRTPIIRNGRFVLKGTEKLNEALEQL